MATAGPWLMEVPFKSHTDVDLFNALHRLKYDCNAPGHSLEAFIEKQWARPTDSRSNLAKLMDNYGMWKGWLIALDIRWQIVTPVQWQKPLGLTFPKKTPQTERKRKHKELAQHLFPGRKVTLATCDALLIAEYGRRLYQ